MTDAAQATSSGSIGLEDGLKKLGYESFRPGQREAIATLVDGGRLLLVAPTGGGKSLVYQLPASLLPGTTLVVSPLISLMNDQVIALEERGVRATYLASTLDRTELRARLEGLRQGDYKIAYVAPERLADQGFRSVLDSIDCPLVAIDEAHCISEWGHDFRPEYMQIGQLLQSLPKARIIACTATATPVVRDEILARLGLGAETPQHLRGFARPNLALRAARAPSDAQRSSEVDALLAEALGGPEKNAGTAIIYSPTRKRTEKEADRLEGLGWKVAAYHAGLSAAARETAQQQFIRGELELVVATNAFGMGIDRSDVRAVIHLGPPGSIEAYYQEVGRAGRDGEPAWGLLLWSERDLPLRRRLLEMPVNDRMPLPEVVEHKWNLFLELMRWAEGGSCRHDAILRYFGDESESLGGCGKCDVCGRLVDDEDASTEEVTLIVRKALSGVARVNRRFGLNAAAKLLHGDTDERLARSGLDEVSTFGILSEYPAAWISKVLNRCVTAGWVTFSGADRPVVQLTREGADVMQGRRPARLILPSKDEALPRRERGPKRPKVDVSDLDENGRDLFELLRLHRTELAREQGVPPYVVASDRTLRELAMLRPTSHDELLTVHGIGPSKAEQYGDGFLLVLRG